MKSKKSEKNKKKIFSILEKIIVIFNIVIVISILSYYGYRFIKYYKIENEVIISKSTIYDTVTLEKNVVSIGSGLYKENNLYTFIGDQVNNYVYYSGKMWRIINIDSDNCTLITDNNQTILAFGDNGSYNNSYIRKWLNKTEEKTGIFYDSLSAPDIYLNEGVWCADEVTNNDYSCNNKVNDYVGLITINEYNNAGGKNSYLNNNSYFWTINNSSNKAWYILNTGDINNKAYDVNNYYNYGVRPVIKLKSDVIVYSGAGTNEDPYIIENTHYNNLCNVNSGQYINYNNNIYRVVENNSSMAKIMLDGYVMENGVSKELSYKDMHDYINALDLKISDKLIESSFYNGNYTKDYQEIYDSKNDMKIGIPSIGDLYITDYKDYYLSNGIDSNSELEYIVLNEGQLYLEKKDNKKKIIILLNIKNDLAIESGTGTRKDPYVVR